MNFQRTRVAFGVALLLGHLAAAAQPAAGSVAGVTMQASFADQEVAPTATLALRFAELFAFAPGRFAVMVGTEDVTANFTLRSPSELLGVFADAPLPAGDQVLKLYGIDARNEWLLLAQAPLKVLATAADAARSVVKPSAVFGIKSQAWEQHSASATPPDRRSYADATPQAGLTTDHGNAEWGLKSSASVIGASRRSEALQYGTRGANAAAIDLASWLVEGFHQGGRLGTARLWFGHVQAGNHPLLASNVASRGVVLKQPLGQRADLMLSSQSSTALLGIDRFTGLTDAHNRVTFATLGAELLPRAGGLRVEATTLVGAARPLAAPGISPPPAAQAGRGWGLRLLGASADNRWRGEFAYARSNSTPMLYASGTYTPGPSRERSAYVLDLTRELLQAQVLSPAWADYPLSLSATFHRERTAPDYHSLGAAVNADAVAQSLGFAGSFGPVNGSVKVETHGDNLARDATRFINRAPTVSATLNAPLAPLFDAKTQSPWWPSLDYSWSRNRAFADTAFVPTGKSAADFNDTVGTTHHLGLGWTVGAASFGYAWNRTLQDDRQLGNAQNDQLDTRHELNASWQASETLHLNGSLTRRLGFAKQTGVQSRGVDAAIGVNWVFAERWTLAANVAANADSDRPFTTATRAASGDVTLTRPFTLPLGNTTLPGQWVLRYAFSHAATRSAGTPNPPPVRYQILNLGFSLAY